ELRDTELRLNETALELRRFLDLLQAEPDRLEQVESELERIADTKRRFRSESYAELLARAGEARAELAALEDGADPLQAASAAVAEAEKRAGKLAERLSKNRRTAAEPFANAVEAELHGVGLGEGEFRAELAERGPTATSASRRSRAIRPTRGSSSWTRTAGRKRSAVCSGARSSCKRCDDHAANVCRAHWARSARPPDEEPRQAAEPRRHRDHRPHRSRPGLGGGADRVGGARGRERRSLADG